MTLQKKISISAITAFLATGIVLFNNCSVSSGRFEGQSSTAGGNPNNELNYGFAAFQAAGITELTVCFGDIELSGPGAAATISRSVAEISISPAGTALGISYIPSGTYAQISMSLESNCASGRSVRLTNSNGTFSTSDSITMSFAGSFTSPSGMPLTLDLQSIANALGQVNDDDEIAPAISGQGGQFDDDD